MRHVLSMGIAALTITALVLAYEVGHARAYGVPQTNTLTYTGSLLTYGAADNSSHNVSVALYVSGTQQCNSPTTAVTCINGQFTIPLPPACVPVVHQNQDVQVQVTVDSQALGMTNLAATPYAVEADTASNAAPGSSLSTALVPTGTVLPYSGGRHATISSGTLATLTSTTNLTVGQFVSGTGVPARTTIAMINSATQLTLSATATNGATILSFAPVGYMFCDGSAVLRGTYTNLFAEIDTVYGAGDGSTTFNLPDFRGRVGAGKDDMSGTAAGHLTSAGLGTAATTLGASGGAETHTLSVAEMPSHSHAQDGYPVAVSWPAGSVWVSYNFGNGDNLNGMATQPSGGGGAHTIVQPTLIVNYIVKY